MIEYWDKQKRLSKANRCDRRLIERDLLSFVFLLDLTPQPLEYRQFSQIGTDS